MSRLADIGLSEVHTRRLSTVWLVTPLLLLGAWELMAPRYQAADHAASTVAAAHGVAPLD